MNITTRVDLPAFAALRARLEAIERELVGHVRDGVLDPENVMFLRGEVLTARPPWHRRSAAHE